MQGARRADSARQMLRRGRDPVGHSAAKEGRSAMTDWGAGGEALKSFASPPL